MTTRKTKKHSRSHAITSPSSSSQWLNCPGSCALSLLTGNLEEENDYTEEGTKAHKMLEDMLRGNAVNATENVEMFVHAQRAVKFIKAMEKKVGGFDEVFIEKRIAINDRIYGKDDYCATYAGGTRLFIMDYKYGKGIPVHAKSNSQLACYAIATQNTLGRKFDRVVACVFQPRAWDGEGDIRHVTYSPEEIAVWEDELVTASNLAHDVVEGRAKATYRTGDWCRFCSGAALCPQAIKNLEEANIVTMPSVRKKSGKLVKGKKGGDEIAFADVERLSIEQLIVIKENSKAVQAFLKKVDVYMRQKMLAGSTFPGFKLVYGRSSRKWLQNIPKVVKRLKQLGVEQPLKTDPQLRGITEIESEIGKDKLGGITYKPEPGIVVALDSDPREEYIPEDTAVSLLDELDIDT